MSVDASDAPQIIEHLGLSVNFTPYAVRWIPASARFVVLGQYPKGTGVMQIYHMGKEKLELMEEKEHPCSIKCGTFAASTFEERQLAVGDYDGNMKIWDLENLEKPVFSVKGHNGLVNCIAGCGGLNVGVGAPEIVTGGRDGCVHVWDPRQQEPVTSLEPADPEHARDCWAVCFGNAFNEEDRCVAAGYDNGDVKMLDLRMNKLLWQTNVGNGVCALQFDRPDIPMNKLVTCGLESSVRAYDTRTLHPDLGFAHTTAPMSETTTCWIAEHLPQNRDIFATSGGSGSLQLFRYRYPSNRTEKDADGVEMGVAGELELLSRKEVCQQPIISLDWHANKEGLVTLCGLDQTIKVAIVTRLNKF